MQEGKNHLDPPQNYKGVKSKYSAGHGTEAAKKAGINAAIDTTVYTALSTDKGRPNLSDAAKTVVTATGEAFVTSAVPGGQLLMTLRKAAASQNYENLPVDLLLAAPSMIPGNPVRFERQHIQTKAPLFGSSLRSDDVERISADFSLPFLRSMPSIGGDISQVTAENSRNGVTTIRKATAANAHLSIGSALEGSLGLLSGTDTEEAVKSETADGDICTTQREKQFSGQFGASLRAADRKDAIDIGPAFNEEIKTTSVKSKADGNAISIYNNLPLRHLKEVEDNFQKGSGTASCVHESYVDRERAELPTDGRVQRICTEQTITTDNKQAFGFWKTGHKTENFDVYKAEENTVHRFDQALPSELETTLTHNHIELSGRDLRESSEETTNFWLFSSKTNKKYPMGEKPDKEVIKAEWSDKTRITSKKDGSAYDARQSTSKDGTTEITEIENDCYKKIYHADTNDQIESIIGQRNTISKEENRQGFFQPEVNTIYSETQQVFERTAEHTELQAPHSVATVNVKQTYGLLTNKTEKSVTISRSEEDKPEEYHEVVKTLGSAANGALSALTSNGLHLLSDPTARTKENVLNAVIDAGIEGAIGLAHSNVAAHQNSIGSTAVAAAVTVAGHVVRGMTSSTDEASSIKEVLKNAALSSAPSVAVGAANLVPGMPDFLKNYAGVIASLCIQTEKVVQEYRDGQMTLDEAIFTIAQNVNSIITEYSITACAVPALVGLLPLGPLGASVASCILVPAMRLAASHGISPNPLHLERQHTQANGPLFGSDLRSDTVDRKTLDFSLPFLSEAASLGLAYDKLRRESSRDGVNTVRNATAINVHASIGNEYDASAGFSSGTDIRPSVTKRTADGKIHTTYWKKEFSGQFGVHVRAGDKKGARDIGPAFKEIITTVDEKQSHGLLKNKTERTIKVSRNGKFKPEEQSHEVVETLGGAANGALSSLTSNGLHLLSDPTARTKENVLNAAIDAVAQGAVGWAHSNMTKQQNSLGSAAIGAVVTVAGHVVREMTSSTDKTLPVKEIFKDAVVSSAPSLVSIVSKVPSNIPGPLKVHAGAITSLVLLINQLRQNYREKQLNLREATTIIAKEITIIISNHGIQTILIPRLVAFLPLGPLGASSDITDNE
ncbi:unnamed protein product [Rotaria sp. Silwood2]|nr:unnamed protein product [Rotaria sp. Silwood2]